MRTLLVLALTWAAVPSAFAHETTNYAATEKSPELAAFFQAARAGDVPGIQKYLDAQGDVNAPNDQGYTALILAAYNGKKEAVDALLDRGADACRKDSHGNTALMGAVFKGNLRIALKLMDQKCGGQVNAKNSDGQNAVLLAAQSGQKEIAQALVAHGADPKAKDKTGKSAISVAEDKFDGEMAEALKKKKKN